ncbi:uncharacterized protein RJT20DRAFT_127992 [Scheffersomyces xylosifermentans]|uniref:uncharacterized protein n=1 Tax=Scheffersomyces xylosifermentans TaxID=1304137 RepID=UPI00315D2B28
MSLTTNRVALAPIHNSRLNSNSSTANSSPKGPTLKNNKQSITSTSQVVGQSKSFRAANLSQKRSIANRLSLAASTTSLALTPLFKKRHSDLSSKSFSLSASTTSTSSISLHRKFSPIKSMSFSDYRSTSSTCSSPNLKAKPRGNQPNVFKNDAAGLAATKLKLKLQLALYKLQQKQSNESTKTLDSQDTLLFATESKTSIKRSITPSESSKNTFRSPTASPTPSNERDQSKVVNQLPIPPEPAPYSSSININLKTKTKLLSKSSPKGKNNSTSNQNNRPSLSKIAYNKQINSNRKNQKLKLFQIKKNSIFHSSNSFTEKKQLPLLVNEVKLPKFSNDGKASATNSLNIITHMPSTLTSFSQNSFLLPYAAASVLGSVSIPSIQINAPSSVVAPNANVGVGSFSNGNSTSLPSINKILKTPMRRANSTRFYPNAATTNQNDDTIDEDNDMTILNTTNNTTINATTNAATTSSGSMLSVLGENAKSSDGATVDEDEEDDKNKTIITSSPISNNFGTPNSFSVAKSLLQLGGHCA